MPGSPPPGMSDAYRCQDTRLKIIQMATYIRSDRKIAQHVGVREDFVASVRATVPDHRDINRRRDPAQRIALRRGREEDGGGEYLGFKIAQREADARFVKALGRFENACIR